MRFTAIMGGTLTMVGWGPLILLNDIIESSNRNLFGMISIPMLIVVV